MFPSLNSKLTTISRDDFTKQLEKEFLNHSYYHERFIYLVDGFSGSGKTHFFQNLIITQS